MSATLPSRLGRYEVLEEIGKGAMGVVYLARDPLIGRLVALKTFRVGFAAKDEELAQFRSRFVREAQSAGILSHPNIVTIHDVVDEGANGICFIAMEYVKGTNLKQQLQNADPFSHNFVVEVISQVAEALDYAHSRGVVHRDIKPANILITADNKVKITDFGIARLDTSNLTMEGQLLGTPNYMAPEQIQGKDVDHRADIFSLGVVFYEMLTRRKPFQGENLTQVTHKIVYEPFTPPEEIVRDLPQGLSAVLTRCLQKDPNRRFPRAAEVARELRAVLEQQQDNLDDTVATQEVAPGAPAAAKATPAPAAPGVPPDAGPTRKLDQSEIAAAVAAAREAMGEGGAAVDAGPTRKLDRAALLAEAGAAAQPPEKGPAAAAPAPASPPAPTQKLPRTPAEPAAPGRKPAPAPPPAPTQKLTPPAPERPPTPRIPPAPGAAAPQPPAPAPPAPAAARTGAAPKRSGGRRTLWLALAGGAAAVVVAAVLLFALGGREPAKPTPLPVAPTTTPEQQNRITAATALSEARTKFASGDLPGALQAVARAELADPKSLEAKLLREAIENRTHELAAEAERQKQIVDGVTAARDATARKDWDRAISSARAVLALDPEQEEAKRLLADAQRAQKRERDRAEATRTAAAAKPAAPKPEPEPVKPAPVAPAPPAAKDAAMRIDFASDQSEGVLTIYAGERQIFREPFKFVKKTGFLRSEKISGTLEGQRRVPTGPLTLRVYVAMPGMPTKAVVLNGTIQGGKNYQLVIKVDADGRATAELK